MVLKEVECSGKEVSGRRRAGEAVKVFPDRQPRRLFRWSIRTIATIAAAAKVAL